jgi:hypothetical protein
MHRHWISRSDIEASFEKIIHEKNDQLGGQSMEELADWWRNIMEEVKRQNGDCTIDEESLVIYFYNTCQNEKMKEVCLRPMYATTF